MNFSSSTTISISSSQFSKPAIPSFIDIDLRNTNTSLCALSESGKTLVVVSTSSTSIVVSLFSSSSSSNWISTFSKSISLSHHHQSEEGVRKIKDETVEKNELDDFRNQLLLQRGNSSQTSCSKSEESIRLRSVKISNETGAILIHYTRVSSPSPLAAITKNEELCVVKNVIHPNNMSPTDEDDENSELLLSDESESLFFFTKNQFTDFTSCGNFIFFIHPKTGLAVGSLILKQSRTSVDATNNNSSDLMAQLMSMKKNQHSLNPNGGNSSASIKEGNIVATSLTDFGSCSVISVSSQNKNYIDIFKLVCFESNGGGFSVLKFDSSFNKVSLLSTFLGTSIESPLASSFVTSSCFALKNSIHICCGWTNSMGENSISSNSQTKSDDGDNNNDISIIQNAIKKRAEMENSSPLAPVIVPGSTTVMNNQTQNKNSLLIQEMNSNDEEDEILSQQQQQEQSHLNVEQQLLAGPSWNQALVRDYQYNPTLSMMATLKTDKNTNDDDKNIFQKLRESSKATSSSQKAASSFMTNMMANESQNKNDKAESIFNFGTATSSTSNINRFSSSSARSIIQSAGSNQLAIMIVNTGSNNNESAKMEEFISVPQVCKSSNVGKVSPEMIRVVSGKDEGQEDWNFNVIVASTMAKEASDSNALSVVSIGGRKKSVQVHEIKDNEKLFQIPADTSSNSLKIPPFVISGFAFSSKKLVMLISKPKLISTTRILSLESQHSNVVEIDLSQFVVQEEKRKEERAKEETLPSSVTLTSLEEMMKRVVGEAVGNFGKKVEERLEKIEGRLGVMESKLNQLQK